MNKQKAIELAGRIAVEGVVVLGGIVIAAWVISRFPALQGFVQQNSVTLKDGQGNVLW